MEPQFYTEVSPFTDLGIHNSSIDELPDDIERICEFVHNVLIHAYWLDKYHFQIDDSAKFFEMQARSTKDILDIAVSKSEVPLNQARPAQHRVVSICRDFSLILCAILRTKGIPSRTRCGFATYLTPDHFEDHWICEYWGDKENRWVMVDAQLDEVHLQTLNIDFRPIDVPHSRFIYAGEAWQWCRSGKASPETFGILNITGFPFIKGNLIRDLFSLNKIELLGWDTGWGILQEYVGPIQNNDEMELLDQLAVVSKTSDSAKAKQLVESQPEIKFPTNWCLSKSPSITDLYAQYQQ